MRTTEAEARRWEDESVDALRECLAPDDDCACEAPMARTTNDGAVNCARCGKELGRWRP